MNRVNIEPLKELRLNSAHQLQNAASVVCSTATEIPETTATSCRLHPRLCTFFAHAQQAKNPRKATMKAANGPLRQKNENIKQSQSANRRAQGKINNKKNGERGTNTARSMSTARSDGAPKSKLCILNLQRFSRYNVQTSQIVYSRKQACWGECSHSFARLAETVATHCGVGPVRVYSIAQLPART